jgi:cellobiose phosphorylase
VGDGTLEAPHGAARLSNRHTRRGPGFFAFSVPFHIRSGETVLANNFTGLVSSIADPQFSSETLTSQISALTQKYSHAGDTAAALDQVCAFAKDYASFLTVQYPDKAYECYVNKNLPFQVFYQTFVSRSFDQTQKGYREIGFREIQDIYASMYYFVASGKTDFVKKLLREWISNVHEMGYANHNFYWQGKEPGFFSDDALWLVQALDRYVTLTKDDQFLKESCFMAGGGERAIFDTVKEIITYSAKISVGAHGLPLMDKTDWNDCLRVDPDFLDGPAKEEAYDKQIKRSGEYGDPLVSEYSESVMNGFLLKCAVDAAEKMAGALGDTAYAEGLNILGGELKEKLQAHCWKGDFFARVLFNRKNKPTLQYLGGKGDGLAVEPDSEGTYYINSFSWAVLAETADDSQIAVMLDTMNRHLKTPYGFRLCTGADYPKIAPRIDVALYFAGDRENGAVFKHANMMAAAAMLKVKSKQAARFMISLSQNLLAFIARLRAAVFSLTACRMQGR